MPPVYRRSHLEPLRIRARSEVGVGHARGRTREGDICGGYLPATPSPRTGRHRVRPCWRVWTSLEGARIPRPGGGGCCQSAAKLLEQRHHRLTGCLPPPRKMRSIRETCAAGRRNHLIEGGCGRRSGREQLEPTLRPVAGLVPRGVHISPDLRRRSREDALRVASELLANTPKPELWDAPTLVAHFCREWGLAGSLPSDDQLG